MAESFEYLRKYWSFSNYQLLMDIVDKHGSDEDRREAEHYRSSFQQLVATRRNGFSAKPLWQSLHVCRKNGHSNYAGGLDQDLVQVGNLMHIHSEFAKIFRCSSVLDAYNFCHYCWEGAM